MRLGAIDLVRTQPGGRGGQAIVINFITVQGGGGVKKGQKTACILNQWPLREFQVGIPSLWIRAYPDLS